MLLFIYKYTCYVKTTKIFKFPSNTDSICTYIFLEYFMVFL